MDRAVRHWRRYDPIVLGILALSGSSLVLFVAYHFLRIDDSIDVCTLLEV